MCIENMQIEKRHFIRAVTECYPCPFEDRGGNTVGQIVPCIFRDFILEELPILATLQVVALGIYEPWMNGERIGERYFAPGWTDYNKLIYTQEYDITAFCQMGKNRFGTLLGDGWFAGNLSAVRKTTYGNRTPEIAMQLTLVYADGQTQTILSDDTFCYAESNILYADFYMGEWIDHRRTSVADIMTPGLVTGKPVQFGEGMDAEQLPDFQLEVKEERRLQPIRMEACQNGKTIVDFGQNFVGIVEVSVRGKTGGSVTLRYGEMLDTDGCIYVENLRSAKSIDRFVCSGEGIETFLPTLTYHGFQYVEIATECATIEKIEGIVLTTILEEAGTFACDHALVNQLYSNIVWGLRGNFLELPTDCPQRDERLGWCGDTQVFCRTAMYKLDCSAFYRKYLRNVRDSINAEGAPCDVVPYVTGFPYGSAAWGDAIIVIPYQHYLFYGDKSIITENMWAMEGWIAYQLRTSHGYIRPEEGYGDWLSVRLDETPKDLLGTAYFAYGAKMLAYLCKEIGDTEKEAYYTGIYEKVSDAFVRNYVSKDGSIVSDSQCSYLVALKFELVHGDLATKVAKKLRQAILRDNAHLTCGFVGISLLLPTLSEWGMNDLAYTILLNDTYPSWGYSIRNGATTIWERWNSFTKEDGFADVGMNSFNHYSLGSCGEWFTGYMGGILPNPETPAFAKIKIAPQLDPEQRIKSASASYECPHGTIVSSWSIQDEKVDFDLIVPEGVEAEFAYGGQVFPLVTGENHFTLAIKEY